MFTLAAASGNLFAFAWRDEWPLGAEGPRWARRLCPRPAGLGLDGLFLLERPVPGEPWVIEHWDPDGSRSFCSNGSRCALALDGAPAGLQVEVLSSGVPIRLRREAEGIGLRMPDGESTGLQLNPLSRPEPHAFGWVGNPQLVLEVADTEVLDLAALAPPLRHHPAFPDGTNVNVIQVLEPGRARIRSWERGVEGETLCCGTGCAVAGAWMAQRTGLARWEFHPSGGDPVVVAAELDGRGRWTELWLTGPVRRLGRFQPEPSLHP